MAIYLLAYDLRKEKSSHDYQPLYDELERLGGHRTQYSLWLLNLSNSAQDVLDHFKQFVDENDRLWVTSVRRGEYAYVNAIAGTTNWLKSNPPA